MNSTELRTNTCGELRKTNIKQKVKLCGWVSKPRDHGGVIFIDLKDRYGITQIVFNPDFKDFKIAEGLRREDVIQVIGSVRNRAKGMENPKLNTGDIEILIEKLNILNKADTPPIEIDDRIEPSEEIKLKYRYLDLRRPTETNKLVFRSKVVHEVRNFFNKNEFLEIETPLLIKSTPEGARDYVVPSRVNPGKFYALPQSPQLYKQLLMISGFDKYFQLARCLRDEDLRSDRQPEHTQFDFEMSFVTQEDIQRLTENLFKHLFKKILNITLEDFPIISYKKSLERYGTDKPDIRFELHTHNVSDIVKDSDFTVFKSVIKSGGIVKCINPPQDISRNEIDRYIQYCQSIGSKGMAWMRVTKDGLESNIAKFFNKDIQKQIISKVKAKPNTILFFIADKQKACNDIISRLRLKVGEDLNLINKDEFRFCFVNDFPLFSYDEDEKRWEPEHHMFSMPKSDFIKDFEKRPKETLGDLWDLVLNGTELGSGSIRISDPKIQSRIMDFVGINKQEAEKKFGFLLEAYRYGGPIHGGMGLGVDRIVALMLKTNDIREVIAFPKNKNAECPMDNSPNQIDNQQLKELHIKTDIIKKTK